MINGKDQVFPIDKSIAMVEGIDLRTWMSTYFMAAFIANKGYDGMRNAKESVQAANALIAELNKRPSP